MSSLYGVTDEFHQSFVPGRSPSVDGLVCGYARGLRGRRPRDGGRAVRQPGPPRIAAYNHRVMAYENLLIERDGGVLVVTINRPEKLNALNTQTVTELGQAMDEAAADAAVRAIVLTGAGEKSFVAGADINELAVQTPVSGREHARSGQACSIGSSSSASRSLRPSTALRSAAAASSPWRARCASRPTRRSSASRKSISASFPATQDRSGCRGWSVAAARSRCC